MNFQIGARIRQARENANMTQTELAKKIGISNSRLSNWEKGLNRPDVDVVASICKALSISANSLLGIEFPYNSDSLSPFEQKHIKKYRALDQRGRDAVDATLDREYEYVTAPPKIQMVARGEGKARELTGKHAEAANKVLKELFKGKNETDK